MIRNEGLSSAAWMMDVVIAAGHVGESGPFGAVEKKMKNKLVEERLKYREKQKASRLEAPKTVGRNDVAASGGAPEGRHSARRN